MFTNTEKIQNPTAIDIFIPKNTLSPDNYKIKISCITSTKLAE